ncbi:hypothetical protein Herbaro_01345 [Herbaspirillum sp. WKF16]|uniref:hypothetical protein n=1 Tax=Herbaspirillum sp. WKF16 TaxID=3028312 RepID=UPI0023A9A2FA|nr:hypothetical protein [Herbaspirillum sp. WKF16]WDZ96458.1 hypothetical protein Herbaro_01345 [Herbaspirillum sp. WKF16]
MPVDTSPFFRNSRNSHNARRRLLQAGCALAIIVGAQAPVMAAARPACHGMPRTAELRQRLPDTAMQPAPARRSRYLLLKLCVAGHACAMTPAAKRRPMRPSS